MLFSASYLWNASNCSLISLYISLLEWIVGDKMISQMIFQRTVTSWFLLIDVFTPTFSFAQVCKEQPTRNSNTACDQGTVCVSSWHSQHVERSKSCWPDLNQAVIKWTVWIEWSMNSWWPLQKPKSSLYALVPNIVIYSVTKNLRHAWKC